MTDYHIFHSNQCKFLISTSTQAYRKLESLNKNMIYKKYLNIWKMTNINSLTDRMNKEITDINSIETTFLNSKSSIKKVFPHIKLKLLYKNYVLSDYKVMFNQVKDIIILYNDNLNTLFIKFSSFFHKIEEIFEENIKRELLSNEKQENYLFETINQCFIYDFFIDKVEFINEVYDFNSLQSKINLMYINNINKQEVYASLTRKEIMIYSFKSFLLLYNPIKTIPLDDVIGIFNLKTSEDQDENVNLLIFNIRFEVYIVKIKINDIADKNEKSLIDKIPICTNNIKENLVVGVFSISISNSVYVLYSNTCIYIYYYLTNNVSLLVNEDFPIKKVIYDKKNDSLIVIGNASHVKFYYLTGKVKKLAFFDKGEYNDIDLIDNKLIIRNCSNGNLIMFTENLVDKVFIN